jgi:hypothetical protein
MVNGKCYSSLGYILLAMWRYSPDRIHPIRRRGHEHMMRNGGDRATYRRRGFVRRPQKVAQMSCARAGGWTFKVRGAF